MVSFFIGFRKLKRNIMYLYTIPRLKGKSSQRVLVLCKEVASNVPLGSLTNVTGC